MQEVTLKNKESELVFALSGEIVSENTDDFFNEVITVYSTNPKDVVFDCAALEFIDSTTLGTFVKILKHLKADGNRLRLKALSPRIRKLFVICSLDSIMEIES